MFTVYFNNIKNNAYIIDIQKNFLYIDGLYTVYTIHNTCIYIYYA